MLARRSGFRWSKEEIAKRLSFPFAPINDVPWVDTFAPRAYLAN
ncbi:MAG: hypothetical protein AVDCRST_MAG25-418 [uncultured Rubrobacteraceae bacterium]|uniref:Uncharacterized protein n=1 Tax=uncultured Rubrobacteraceae bacterium TaxID=349277 RepID=A0A6J4QXF1_9ACTN|nr:MAG: hypothetical protein AVDCRST_MAG25-418 [uncultured Rubrobacteraceae bacterium]